MRKFLEGLGHAMSVDKRWVVSTACKMLRCNLRCQEHEPVFFDRIFVLGLELLSNVDVRCLRLHVKLMRCHEWSENFCVGLFLLHNSNKSIMMTVNISSERKHLTMYWIYVAVWLHYAPEGAYTVPYFSFYIILLHEMIISLHRHLTKHHSSQTFWDLS